MKRYISVVFVCTVNTIILQRIEGEYLKKHLAFQLIAAGIDGSTTSEMDLVLDDLHKELSKAIEVLDLQEQLAMAWCLGQANDAMQNDNSVGPHDNNAPRMEKIRATVDHLVQSGFVQCQEKFVFGWMNALMGVEELSAGDSDRLKTDLRLCIKSAKTAALSTLDELKMECFLNIV